MSDIVVRPIEKIKKKCLCCGKEMEIFPYVEQDFCNRCFPIVCREVFNKANDDITPKSFGEKVLEYLWNDVTKHDHSILFLDTIKSFDQLLTDYLNKKQVFKFDF